MAIERPTPEALRETGAELGMTISEADAQSYLALMGGLLDAYDAIDGMDDNLPEVKYPRASGAPPAAKDNPYKAWYWRCDIRGAASGPLAGKRVAIKDNTCVANLPMMNGASTFEGYVPEVDATVVTRLLDAGAIIKGKAVCEYFCCSGGSHTSATGAVDNPRKAGYSAGGSSSGSAALVAAGEVDMATGGDQGGSIRIPASYCGIVGMKPTHGLVPYTGIMPIELTVDHCGPMTATVADNALMLEVIAGEDGLDPRQYAPRTARYTNALGGDAKGLRIGVVTEGFGFDHSDPEVDAMVRDAARRFGGLGAKVDEVSIPMHRAGPAIWTPIFAEGATELMMLGDGYGTNHDGLFLTSLMAHHAGWRKRADELSETLKLGMLIGHYAGKRYGHRFYAKAHNINRQLRAAYDGALERFDLLLMPTTPVAASKLPAPNAPREEVVQRAFEMIDNTCPFDTTGHPALSVPCATTGDGRPAGMMLIAKHWAESTLYRAADAYEQSVNWQEV